MQTTSLRKGENTGLSTAVVVLAVSVHGLAADVSALLLGTDGRVRSDDDLVFYNHPAQDGVSVAGPVVTADLERVPADVDRLVVVVSADPLQPGAVFTRAPLLSITQTGSPTSLFTAPDFTSGETVVVLAELYRRDGGWKIRAVGQGYASGLTGLATDYGVDVESEPAAPPAPLPAQGRRDSSSAQPAVDLSKVERLALSATLDDDGAVPVVFSSGREPFLEEIRLDNYRGRIGQLHTQVDWGWGNVADAMRRAVGHYQESGAADPAFIVTQVGDEPWDKAEVRSLLQNTASLGVFWLFVGLGRGKLAFYKNLNASASVTFTNVAFYDASKNPGSVPDERFYAGLVDAFATWLRQ
ncbi:TerD family protein [Streptomyces sp. NPDC001581]|uniref:TerD family protein n=1 Tax=Streptomyces sp. NPDC001581 TaxID=3154386 RepID=UPI0033255DEE